MSLLIFNKMTLDKKELIKLSPQERIKKLRLMEEDRKKEVNEIEILIKESMQELRTARIAEEITPEQRPVDISRLFEAEDKQRVERTAKREAPPTAFMKGARNYQANSQIEYDYSQKKSYEEQRTVGKIGERDTTAGRYMTEGEKSASILNPSKATLHKLKKETGLD